MGTAPDDGVRPLRPWALTIFCSIGFILFPIFVITHFAPDTYSMMVTATSEAFYEWHFILSCTQVVAYVGLWRMKKWGWMLFVLSSLVLIPYHYLQSEALVELHEQVVAEDYSSTYQAPADGKNTAMLTKAARKNIAAGAPITPWVQFGKAFIITLCVILVATLSRKAMTAGFW